MKPFLRWAGGKNWLVKYIDKIIASNQFNNYHEPFLGGGSIFFHLNHQNQCFLSDLNLELINTYIQVRDNVESVIKYMKQYTNSKEFYYELRSKSIDNEIERAAQFIYLNQTSFNGIYRVNLKGVYNVPYGQRAKKFLEEDVLRNASKKLKNVNLNSSTFQNSISNIEKDDIVFLDPPYTITHNNNGFVKYNESLFSVQNQHDLAEYIAHIIEKGAYYVLTNAAHDSIAEIFNFNNPIHLTRASLIGGKEAKRGKYEEFLFTNLENEFIEANRS